MKNFINTSYRRGTSVEIMEAIYYVSGRIDLEASRIWDAPTETELISIWERVTKNGLISADTFFWGIEGRNWANGINE